MTLHNQAIRAVTVSITGLVSTIAATPSAFAASTQPDVDWRAYLDWHSYSEWQWLVLGASVALLVVALLLQSVQAMKSRRDSEQSLESGDHYRRPFGTMTLERPRPVDVQS